MPATWHDLPFELKLQIVDHLIDDAYEETNEACVVRRPRPHIFHPNYDPKYNLKQFDVQWLSRSVVILTGLYVLVKAIPTMGEAVETLCQQRQSRLKQALRAGRMTQQLVFHRQQPPWKPHRDGFFWIPTAESRMQEIATYHHLGGIRGADLTPEEPGEITEDIYEISMD